jgi:hypothetical protein
MEIKIMLPGNYLRDIVVHLEIQIFLISFMSKDYLSSQAISLLSLVDRRGFDG